MEESRFCYSRVEVVVGGGVKAAYANVINRLGAEKRERDFKRTRNKNEKREKKKRPKMFFVWRRKQLEHSTLQTSSEKTSDTFEAALTLSHTDL